jgi:hypothetical protein
MTHRPAMGALIAAFIAVACCAGLPVIAGVGASLIAPLAGLVVLVVAVGSVVVHRRRCRSDPTRGAQSR